MDVKGCVAALREIDFEGWAIVELDRPEPGSTPKDCAIANARLRHRSSSASLCMTLPARCATQVDFANYNFAEIAANPRQTAHQESVVRP